MSYRNMFALVVLYFVGPAFLMMTNPEHLPLPLLVLPFIWAFAALFVTSWLLLGLSKVLSRSKRQLLLSGIISVLPVLILVLNSIHQLTIRDVLLVLAIIAIIAFYMSRADFIK